MKLLKALSSLALLTAIIVESKHSFVDRVPWGGLTPFANYVSFLLVPIWALAIWGIWSRRTFAKLCMVVGIFLLGTHGAVLSLGGNGRSFGVTYVILGLVAGFSAAFGHRFFDRPSGKRKEAGEGLRRSA